MLGRLDPKTGEFKEYRLTRSQTAPHGLVEDRDGNIWFTGNSAGLIGKLDPKTGDVTEYKMPDPAAKDPHTLVFDHDGILWFSVQQANFVGRLDPKTGEIKLATPPTAKARPYGMAVNSKNVVFFVEFGANKVASIDGQTMKITEYVLPDPGARPRRIAIDSDDIVWYTDFARGFLGRLDPATGQVTEWPSPSGPKSLALRHRLHQGRALVQRVRRQAQHDRALRPQDREIPILGDPGRRRHRAQHGCDARRQPGAGQQPGQPGRAGADKMIGLVLRRRTRVGKGRPACAVSKDGHGRDRRDLPILRDARLRRAPQDEVCGGQIHRFRLTDLM